MADRAMAKKGVSEDISNLKSNNRFFDWFSAYYDVWLVSAWMRRMYRWAIVEIDGKGAVLDASCGTGNMLYELSEKGAGPLYGIDYSEKMVEKAQQKLRGKAVVHRADVHRLPFADGEFKYVVSTEAFHHYFNQKIALGELARVTAKGGKVIICDIDLGSRLIHSLFEKIEPGCVRVNSKPEMKSLFEETGLGGIKQERTGWMSAKTVGIKI